MFYMGKITGLVRKKGREKKIRVFLDGQYSCTLLAETVLKEGLRTGQELVPGQLADLTSKDHFQSCFNAALRYLGYRPRSEAEIKERLRKRGYDSNCTETAVSRLKEQGLVDDIAFARFWKENRESFSPRSRRLTALELRRKGLNNDIITDITGEIDDSENAYRAALKKARLLAPTDDTIFNRRLAAYLGRRGFGYDVIDQTMKRIRREQGNSEGSLSKQGPEAARIRR